MAVNVLTVVFLFGFVPLHDKLHPTEPSLTPHNQCIARNQNTGMRNIFKIMPLPFITGSRVHSKTSILSNSKHMKVSALNTQSEMPIPATQVIFQSMLVTALMNIMKSVNNAKRMHELKKL